MPINSIIQTFTQVLANTSRFSTVEAEKQTSGQLPLAPGQPVQAEILASLPNNRFLARIAGELFRMELPVIVQPGETLEMTYVTGEPRPTFSFSISGNAETPVQISDIGKWLNQLSRYALPEEEGTVLPRRNMVLDGSPDNTAALAGKLRETLSLSGIFYESHLMQCFLGERQIKDILREPQGKLARTSKGNNKINPQDNPTAVKEEEASFLPIEDDRCEPTANGNRSASGRYVHPSAEGIVKEQLQTLTSGIFAWHGQVWPEQEMDWSVREREPQNGDSGCREWETTLDMTLPNMGGISSVLQLKKDGLHLRIYADKRSSADSMRSGAEDLVQAMTMAGVKLVEMVIEHEEPGS